MPPIEPFPAIAGREFYCLDRLSPPDELVIAEGPVPGHPQIWVVMDGRGHRFVCPLASLADVPPAELWRRLRDEAGVSCESP